MVSALNNYHPLHICAVSFSQGGNYVWERVFFQAIKAMHRRSVREGTLWEIWLVIRGIWWFFSSCGRAFSSLLTVFSVHLGVLQKGEAPLSHESIFIEILARVCECRNGGCLFNRLAMKSVELQWELEGTPILFSIQFIFH